MKHRSDDVEFCRLHFYKQSTFAVIAEYLESTKQKVNLFVTPLVKFSESTFEFERKCFVSFMAIFIINLIHLQG